MKRLKDLDTFTVFLIAWLFGLTTGIAFCEFFWLLIEKA